MEAETVSIRELHTAQKKAEILFHKIEKRGLIRAGIRESQLNEGIYSLAQEMYGINWHKRIVEREAEAAIGHGTGLRRGQTIFPGKSRRHRLRTVRICRSTGEELRLGVRRSDGRPF
jgi:hypothetical protein